MKGFADIHNHQFAYLGFGGRAFHGAAYGDPADALPWCDCIPGVGPCIPGVGPRIPIHGPGGSSDTLGNIIRNQYGGSLLGLFGHKVGGYPQFDGWPRWDSVSHQSMFEDWLLRAVAGGLRLMVMHAVNNESVCGIVNSPLSCNDMEAVDRQLQAAKDMETYIDAKNGGPGTGWYRIVSSPGEARAVIA